VRPARRVAALLGVAVVVLAYALVDRRVVTPRDELSVLISNGDTSRISAPDTVLRGMPFDVTFGTFGGGCVREHARTAVTMSTANAVVQPYDHNTGGYSCPADKLILQHSAQLRFDVAGIASVRVAGRQGEVARTVVVR
jgi:hypothetical protein